MAAASSDGLDSLVEELVAALSEEEEAMAPEVAACCCACLLDSPVLRPALLAHGAAAGLARGLLRAAAEAEGGPASQPAMAALAVGVRLAAGLRAERSAGVDWESAAEASRAFAAAYAEGKDVVAAQVAQAVLQAVDSVALLEAD